MHAVLILVASLISFPALAAGSARMESVAASTGYPALAAEGNPFASQWRTRFDSVPFDQIDVAHLPEALDRGMRLQREAVARIAGDAGSPTIANTLDPLERSGADLRRARAVLGVYSSALSNDAVRDIQRRYAGPLAAHESAIYQDQRLFERIRALHEDEALTADHPEAKRLAERLYLRFVRSGAALDPAARARVAELSQREAALQTQFGQNVLSDTDDWLLVIGPDDLDGLPQRIRAAARQTAAARGHEGMYAFTLHGPSVETFLTHSSRRDLRETLHQRFRSRGGHDGATNNWPVVAELVLVRAERAELLGYASHAHFITADAMAQHPGAVMDLLHQLWEPAIAQIDRDRADLTALLHEDHPGAALEPHDWRYYAERLRRERFDLDPSELSQYFALDHLLAASFDVAERLFGLRFKETNDVAVWHPDVRVYEVQDAAGQHAGLFYTDFFARPGKRSGAWMSNLRPQQRLDAPLTAHVTNTLNVAQAPEGEMTLLSPGEAKTLFHELGHALHGLLSNVRYPSLSGTSVPRDYVEMHAQFMEHYLTQPRVLERFARHVDTGEPMPQALLERFLRASRFGQGFRTTEFLASAFVDQRFHALSATEAAQIDPKAFEASVLREIGAPAEIPMRHATPHFGHAFSGGYSAGYYSYIWSAVLDADAFAAFEETGDIFDRETADRLLHYIFSRGDTLDWMSAYLSFRGGLPSVQPLLRNRGLVE